MPVRVTDAAARQPIPYRRSTRCPAGRALAWPGLCLALCLGLCLALVSAADAAPRMQPQPSGAAHELFREPTPFAPWRAGSPLLRDRPPREPLLEQDTPFQSKAVTVDSAGAHYNRRLAGFDDGPPITLPLETYLLLGNQHLYRTTWQETVRRDMRQATARSIGGGSGRRLEWRVPIPAPPRVRRLIGDEGSLRISGSHTASIGGKSQWTAGEVQTLAGRPSKFPALSMDQESQFAVEGNVGEAINIRITQDTQDLGSSFSQSLQDQLANQIKLDYRGDEDDIFQEVQAGNTTLSLPNTRFVGFNQQHKGLFGVRAKGHLGPVSFTTIASHEKSESRRQSFRGGAQVDTSRFHDYEFVRNQWFFLDPVYREGLPDYGEVVNADFVPEDPIDDSSLQVYVNDFNVNNDAEQLARPGRAQADLADSGNDSTGHREIGTWHRLDPDNDYVLINELGYIILRQPVQERYALAVAYRTLSGRQVGTVPAAPDSLQLRLIKARDARPGFPTWDLEWKNVYRIVRGFARGRLFDEDKIRVEILREVPGKEPENTQGGRSFLQLMGLDTHGQDPGTRPDQIIDADYIGLDGSQGVLIFPDQRPFDPQLPRYALETRVPEIYDSQQRRDQVEASRYIIQVINSSAQQRISLTEGRLASIDPKSVDVRLNGERLTEGTDYSVTFTGEVQFLGATADAVADPAADLEITFESQDLIGFGSQQKTLLGARGEYEFLGGDGVLGGTLLYNNVRSADRRVQVGAEPARTVVWDMDVRARFDAPQLTRAVDALPGLKTAEPSNVLVQAEIAQSRPNLNTRGQGFIDDFEGSERPEILSVFRSRWTRASIPVDPMLDDSNRGTTIWYNPFDRVERISIWPRQEDQLETNQNDTDVLTLKVTPPVDAAGSAWGAVMTVFTGGVRDFSQSKFVGIWLRGRSGQLHLDLGDISEDWIVNGRIDTEDNPLPGRTTGDGEVSREEDIGIDRRTDEAEFDHYLLEAGAVSPADLEGLSFDEKRAAFGDRMRALGREPTDPEGDNWDYDPSRDKSNYTRINGTQGNQRTSEGGLQPDTEDLNGDGNLGLRNDYYHYVIDLAADGHEPDTCSEPEVAGRCDGWRFYRLRMYDESVERVGSPDSSRIEFARLTFVTDNMPGSPDSVAIAQMEIIGNEWQEQGVARHDSTSTLVTKDEILNITVIGTDENQGYEPPPGVRGQRSLTSRVREREQSLVLDAVNLEAGHKASATRVLASNANYTKYRSLRMFVHGDRHDTYTVGPDSSELELFVRFGADSLNHYEYVTRVFPGWDERNEVEMDLQLMSRLKAELQRGRFDTTGMRLTQLDTVVTDRSVRDGAAAIYRVRGNPSMQQVRQLSLGLRNRSRERPFTGQVYVDELRLDEARNDAGIAAYARVNTQLADFMDLDATVDWRAENFRTIANTERKSADLSTNLSTTTNLHQFLPGSWGMTVPMKLTLSRNLSLPRFAPNSDVELTSTEKDSMRTEQTKRFVELSASKRAGKHWASRWTVDQVNVRWSRSLDERRSPVTPLDETRAQTLSFSYKMPLPKPKIEYLQWMPEYVPSALRTSQLTPVPTTAAYSVNVNHQETQSWRATQIDTTFNEVFTLKETYSTKVSPLRSLSADYSLQIDRDLRKKYEPTSLAFGREVSRNQKADVKLQVRLVRWLDPTFTFQANYGENSDPRRSRQTAFVDTVDDELQVIQTLDINTKNTLSARVSVRLPDVLRALGEPGRRTRSRMPSRRRRPPDEEQAQQQEPEEESEPQPFFVRRFLHFSAGYVEPYSYSWRRNTDTRGFNLAERPSLSYQLGLDDSLRVGQRRAGLTQQDTWSRTTNTDMSSGLRLPLGFSVKPTYKEQISRRSGSTQNRLRVERTLSYPSLNIAWTRADRIPGLRRYLNSAQVNVRLENADTQQAEGSLALSNLIQESEKNEWTASWNGQWRIGPSTHVELRRSRDESVDYELADFADSTFVPGERPPLRGTGVNERRSTKIETRYKLRPRSLPLFGQLRSNVDLRLTLTFDSQIRRSATGDEQLVPIASSERWETSLNGTYQFSESFRGEGIVRVENDSNKITDRTRKVREVRFSGTLIFK